MKYITVLISFFIIFINTTCFAEGWSEEGLRSTIKITLKEIDMYSIDFEDLLIGTASIETGMGKWLIGKVDKNDLGLFQMNIHTHNDLYNHYFNRHTEYLKNVKYYYWNDYSSRDNLLINIQYQIAMAAYHYKRYQKNIHKMKLDVNLCAELWQDIYHRKQNKKHFYIKAWKEYIENTQD